MRSPGRVVGQPDQNDAPDRIDQTTSLVNEYTLRMKPNLTHFASSSTKYLKRNASPILISRDDMGRSVEDGGKCYNELVSA